MGNTGVLQYARFLQAKTIGGMAQKLGIAWPPSPLISVRNLLQLAGDLVAKRSDIVKAPWAVLLCKFSDNLSEPYPRSFYENLFTVSGAGTFNMTDFFRDASQRKLDVTGSTVFGWFTLDQRHSDYKGNVPGPGGRTDLIKWAKQKASENVVLKPYPLIVVVMNVPTDLFGVTGGGVAVCDHLSAASQIAQEMGHGYGLDHSRADNVNDSPLDGNCLDPPPDYRDAWDTMSTMCAYQAPSPKYIAVGPFLNAANMNNLGWLNLSRVWMAAGPKRETIILRPLGRPDLPGWIAAWISAPRVGDFFVEFRVNEGWDANIPKSAVLVHTFVDNHSYIISGRSGKQDLVAGDTFEFSDLGGNPRRVKVEVVNVDPVNYTATVRLEIR